MVLWWLYHKYNYNGYNIGINERLWGGYIMFKIQKIDKVNKASANVARTIRFPEDLFDKYNEISSETGVSFNSLVIEAMRYALNDLEIEENNTKKNNKK